MELAPHPVELVLFGMFLGLFLGPLIAGIYLAVKLGGRTRR